MPSTLGTIVRPVAGLLWVFMAVTGYVGYRLLTRLNMPPWLAIVISVAVIWLLFTIWGYFLGPQGGRPVTKRDYDILDRRTKYQTPRGRRMILDSYQAAALVVRDARRLKAEEGLDDDQALGAALHAMTSRLIQVRSRYVGTRQEDYMMDQAYERYGLVLGVLVKEGVLNDRDQPLDHYGITREQAFRDPALLVSLSDVSTLQEWPSD